MSVDKYLVSIVVPVYNGEKYLRQCLDSIISQTIFNKLEVILINDGSTDMTPVICDEYKNNYKNISVIHQKNHGLVASRKLGASRASSRYITYIDADDWIDSTYIESLLNAMQTPNCELVIADMKYEFGTYSKGFEYSLFPGIYEGNALDTFKYKYLYSDKFFGFGSNVCICGKLFILDKYVPFQEAVPNELKIGEDVAVTVPYVMGITGAVIQLKNVFYHYRQLESSMVHNRANPSREEETKKLYHCLDNISYQDEIVKNRINYYKASMLIGLIKNNCCLKPHVIDKYKEVRRIASNQENQAVIRSISPKTMNPTYKLFFFLLRHKMCVLITIIVQVFK